MGTENAKDRHLRFAVMCTGPDGDKARFHEMMAKFYRLSASDQRIFMAIPNPGSIEAVAQGCTCPMLDNARGRGYMCLGDMFVIQDGCPVHCPQPASFCEEQSDD